MNLNKLKISKKDFSDILAEIIIEEGHYADPVHDKKKKKSLKEADEFNDQVKQKAENPENAPITDRETLSLKAKSIKEGIELWFRQFRVKEDTIQLQHGNKAIISDGSGNSFYILFRVNSWNPPAVEIKEMKLIDITDYANEVPEDL